MAPGVDSPQRTPLGEGHGQHGQEDPLGGVRTVPIHTPKIQMSAPPDDPMDITTPTDSTARPSASKSPEEDANGADDGLNGGYTTQPESQAQAQNNSSMTMPAPAAAAAAVHQPKIVQTAFIHKLYNMLEDQSIQHLISWSQTNESFTMTPSQDFSKVLAQYFKHTNVSSFVRQLNMYGFHKVSDVFHNGSPDQTVWEFKHGNGSFKRGDLVGLREIKRRASRQSGIHRDYNSQKPLPSQPGTPSEPIHPIPDVVTPGYGGGNYEYSMQEVLARLDRSEREAQFMHIKCQTIVETVTRLLHYNQELTRSVLSLSHHEHHVHRDLLALQQEIQRQTEIMMDNSHEPQYASGRSYLANIDNPPLSPHQFPQDDTRRSSLAVPQSRGAYNYRPQVPSNLSINTRRLYGSIGGGTAPTVNTATTQSSPSSLRPLAPPVPSHLMAHGPHPGMMGRRHTSADIRNDGWQPNPNPYVSGPPSSQWPSSPTRHAMEDQRLRDDMPHYSLQGPAPNSRPPTPPGHSGAPSTNGGGLESLNNWSWNSNSSRRTLGVNDYSAPPTRRGSMAHILNPTDTAERDGELEDDPRGDDDRKRKRLI